MIPSERKATKREKKIPDHLLYDVMDGKPIYYRRYSKVVNKRKEREDIIGSTALQGVIVSFILGVLYKNLHEQDYWLLPKAGVHRNHLNNLSSDIVICDKGRLKASDIRDKYIDIPTNVVVEVGTKAHQTKVKFEEYLKKKTTKFHAFGVDKIIWILTASKQVIIAEPIKTG